MLGSEGVTEHLTLHLREHLPRTVAAIRTNRAATKQELPDVHKIYPVVKRYSAVGQYPAVFIEERATTGRLGNRESDLDADWDEYSYRYQYRIWIWAMSDSEEQTALQVKRYTQAVESALLQDKLIHQSETDHAAVDPAVIRHSYSDVAQNEAKKMLGGSYVEIEIATHERLGAFPDYTDRTTALDSEVEPEQ